MEAALREVAGGLVEAARAMGATAARSSGRCCCPRRCPALLRALTITFVSLTGYSAMAGAIGGGGLGDLGIRYGYQQVSCRKSCWPWCWC